MRSLGLAFLALAFTAPSASAAVIEIREDFCGCDPSSGDMDTRTVVVRAEPGEVNVLRVEQTARGVILSDSGAELTGACRPATTFPGRFCHGFYAGGELHLGDGDDSVEVRGPSSFIDAGPGADSVLVHTGVHRLFGGPGPDELVAGLDGTATVSYLDHSEGVTVRLNDVADDGAPGEGDDVRGAVTGIEGGSGDDVLESGPLGLLVAGGDGDDRLLAGPLGVTVAGGAGDDELLGAGGDDLLRGGQGADVLSGGEGRDQAAYFEHTEPLSLTIGDGANDGAAGEGDDIRADVEEVGGGDGPDLLVGNDEPNGLSGGPGGDTLRGLGGADRLLGLGDGDLLDPGSGADDVRAGGEDTLELVDGEADFVRCNGTGPAIHADDPDSLRSCAPRVWLRTRGFNSRGVARIFVRCDVRSTVPCSGRVSLWLGGKRVSRVARFGPIDPGRRAPRAVTLLARRLPRPGGRCLGVRAITVRDDVETQTLSKGAACRMLPGRPSG